MRVHIEGVIDQAFLLNLFQKNCCYIVDFWYVNVVGSVTLCLYILRVCV